MCLFVWSITDDIIKMWFPVMLLVGHFLYNNSLNVAVIYHWTANWQNTAYFSVNKLWVVKCVQGFFKCDLNQTKMITLVSYNRCSWSARTQEARENAYESAGNGYMFHRGLMEKTARDLLEPIRKCSKERQKVIKLLSQNCKAPLQTIPFNRASSFWVISTRYCVFLCNKSM